MCFALGATNKVSPDHTRLRVDPQTIVKTTTDANNADDDDGDDDDDEDGDDDDDGNRDGQEQRHTEKRKLKRLEWDVY